MLRSSFLWWLILGLLGIAGVLFLPRAFLVWLGFPIAGLVLLLAAWGWRWSNQLGQAQLNRLHTAIETAAHGLTALGVLTVAVLFVEERQWDPRFSVDVKVDAQTIPQASKKTAVVQLAIAVTNQGRVSQSVNYIEVAALGLSGNPATDLAELPDLKATEIYKVRTSRWIGIGPGETEYQYVEVPISCEWSLVRVLVKVPEPPVHIRNGQEKIPVYERKLLVPLETPCRSPAKSSRK
jgi:hypothetical protein